MPELVDAPSGARPMRLRRFAGRDVRRVSAAARAALGDDVMIVETRVNRGGGDPWFEIVAASADEVRLFRDQLEADPLGIRGGETGAPRPPVIALVGPAGGGKTTALACLSVGVDAFATRRVGFLSLDTYRVAGLEHVRQLAQLLAVPLEVAYGPEEVAPALARLAGTDVVLVDTPGRSAGATAPADWVETLQAIAPDEVHLVLPASIRIEVAAALLETLAPVGPTHLLITRLDEVRQDAGVATLAAELGLPCRWVTDGPAIHDALHAGPARILASLRAPAPAPLAGGAA